MISRRGVTTALGSMLAIVLLTVAFYRVDGQGLKRQLLTVDWRVLTAMALLSLVGLFCRGIRWWLLLARPVKKPEFWGIQRALAVSYAVGNVVSRLAEVVRIAIARAETKRDIGSLTGTVVLDRLVFDGMAFGLMLVMALLWNREQLVSMLPGALAFIWSFAGLLLVGCAGLLCLAFAPQWVRACVQWLRLDRIPKLGPFGMRAIDQLHAGLQVLAQPKYLLAATAMNLLVWLLPFGYFLLALNAFEVEASLGAAWFVFSLTVVGVLIPSPGGLGSYHLMVTLGLTQLIGVQPEKAAALALLTHGVNYLMLFVAGLPCWLMSRGVLNHPQPEAELVR